MPRASTIRWLTAFAVLSLLPTPAARADSFRCGAEEVTAIAVNKEPAVKSEQASGEIEKLIAEIKEDDFPTDKAREVALAKVTDALAKTDYKLPADFLKPSELLSVLADEAGLPELSYSVLLQKENKNAFITRDPDGVREWLYGTVAGIQKGYKDDWEDFELAPVTDKRLGFVEATKDTPKGVVKSAWKYEGGKCNWSFTIPDGTKATVCVNGICARYEAGSYQVEIKKAAP